MRVVFVTRRYWPAIGGVERVAMTLGEALADDGHEVTVVAQSVDEGHFGRMTHIVRENKIFAPFTLRGVHVVQFRPSRRRRALLLPLAAELIPFGGRVSQRWLRAYAAGYYTTVVRSGLAPLLANADVVHVLGGEVMAVAGIETAHALGVPGVVSPFAHPGHWGYDSGSVRAYLAADVVIATTQADANAYRAIGVPEARLEVIGLAVPEPSPSDPLDEPGGHPLIAFVGARRPTKGLDILLAAADHVWSSHPSATFAFVGPGDPLPLSDPRLIDVGRVSDGERGRWLARSTLLCLPSEGESFGLVVPEAWSHGVPVVVSDIPVLRELVDSSGGGIHAPRNPEAIAQAIVSLLDEPQRARMMGRLGFEYWQAHLTPRAVMARHLEIYRELVAASRRDMPRASRPRRHAQTAVQVRSRAR